MQDKVDIYFAQFCYAGNGGVATVLPEFVPWYAKVSAQLEADPRVGRVGWQKYGDIPLSMERNRVVKDAREGGYDVIVMLDSDNVPDLYVGSDPEAAEFISSSLDFLLLRRRHGLPSVVCAPYCGPPPHPVRGGEENVYVFQFQNRVSDEPATDSGVRLEPYSRNHAAIMRGIQAIGAGPTGVIMYSVDAFELLPVVETNSIEILQDVRDGKLSLERAQQLLDRESWFFYEHPDREQTTKASTEDVTNTREIQFAGIEKFGHSVVFCNWDSWAGHYKPKCVGKPSVIPIEAVSGMFREAVQEGYAASERCLDVDFTGDGA